MKNITIKISLLIAVTAFASCVATPEIEFNVDQKTIAIGADGGEYTFNVASSGSWVAMTESPWITVSPANGKGSQECKVIIDSTIKYTSRTGVVRIQSLDENNDPKDFEVVQDGYDYQICLKDTEKKVEDYAAYGERTFEVKVKANVDFDVEVPVNASGWLSYKKNDLNLDRGSRPRESVIRFEWKVNSRDQERIADIVFKPKETVDMGRHDGLKVVQKAALPIPENTAAGDSLAILAVSRALGAYNEWDTSEKMEYWNNVEVWKEGENKGRVKYVQFFLFNTKEEIPYEIQYLTAAEEISIYSNANHFLRSLDTGEHITKLTQLKRLTIGAYGLTSLHPDFKNLKSLEYLDLSSNCFEEIPEILTPENFPALHSLQFNANQRYTIYDMSNDIRENIGGLVAEHLNTDKGQKAFKRLLKWENLDTLRLSVNYLQGEIPDMMDEGLDCWTYEELKDSLAVEATELPARLQNVPKVLPNTKLFAINFNRLTGALPEWVLVHPHLDLWVPFSLVFPQEGKNKDGVNAGFYNEPASLDEYYEIYPRKKYNPANIKEDESDE